MEPPPQSARMTDGVAKGVVLIFERRCQALHVYIAYIYICISLHMCVFTNSCTNSHFTLDPSQCTVAGAQSLSHGKLGPPCFLTMTPWPTKQGGGLACRC